MSLTLYCWPQVDANGVVDVGCGDGIHVYNSSGKLIGKIVIQPSGATNMCFGKPGEMYVGASDNFLCKLHLDPGVRAPDP